MYGQVGCSDHFAALFAPESENYKYEYTKDDMERLGMPCGDVDSMFIPYGYAIDLYDDDGFGGEVRTYVGQPYEGSHNEMHCTEVGDDFHNKACSAAVYKTRLLGAARGYWDSITATENIDFTVHYGM